MKKSAFLILLFALALLQCELIELPVYVEPAEEKLAISSVMIGRAGLVVIATRSFSALSAERVETLTENFIETILVRSGRIVLTRGNRTDTLSGGGTVPGFYGTLTDGIRDGDSLNITVFDTLTGLSCTASTTLIAPVSIDSVSADSISIFDITIPQIDVWITDPPEQQWFSMHVYDANDFASIFSDSLFFQGNDRVLFSEVFSDRVADSSIIRRRFSVDRDRFLNDTMLVVLSSIEDGYFRFLDARRRTGGFIASLANEPINYPSNVIGGYGYFSAHQPTAFSVYYDRFKKKTVFRRKEIIFPLPNR